MLSVKECGQALAVAMMPCTRAQLAVDYEERLCEWAEAVVGDQLRGMRSPDDLITFFGELADLIQPAGSMPVDGSSAETFDPHSSFGKFLRRCTLVFDELTYEARHLRFLTLACLLMCKVLHMGAS